MDRREFMRGLAGASLIGLAVLAVPMHAAAAGAASSPTLDSPRLGRLLRGTTDGLILESIDRGATWQTTAKFGSHCSIESLRERQGLVHAKVAVGGSSFVVASADARRWLTTG